MQADQLILQVHLKYSGSGRVHNLVGRAMPQTVFWQGCSFVVLSALHTGNILSLGPKALTSSSFLTMAV